ncbi:MAG: hypothetical protein ACK4RK_18585 [Gemmataceae bacterium]
MTYFRAHYQDGLIAVSWLATLAGVLTLSATEAGWTHNTIRLALVYYGIAAVLMLRLRPEEWFAAEGRGRLARWCWTLAWLSYVIHVGLAFHFYHQWSHAHAVAHTRQVSGWGAGIYVSHLFTLLWGLDVVWWWLMPVAYARRSAWIDRLLHGFLAFIIFNGTVIFESGFVRWFGLLMFIVLAVLRFQKSEIRSEKSRSLKSKIYTSRGPC